MHAIFEYFLSLSVKKLLALVVLCNTVALGLSVAFVYLLTTI